jgi:hypothetical protein
MAAGSMHAHPTGMVPAGTAHQWSRWGTQTLAAPSSTRVLISHVLSNIPFHDVARGEQHLPTS